MKHFCRLPIEVQHKILQHMPMKDFLKTAITSKAIMEVASTCRDKFWNETLYVDGYGVPSNALGDIPNPKIFKLLFHDSVVDRGVIFQPIPTGIDVRFLTMEVWADLSPLPILKRHQPPGKYVRVRLNGPEVNGSNLPEWLCENAEFLEVDLSKPTMDYITLKGPRMNLLYTDFTGMGSVNYPQAVVESWLRMEREIELVNVLCESYAFRMSSMWHFIPEYWVQYPSMFKKRTALYRVPRADGRILIVEFSDCKECYVTDGVQHTIIQRFMDLETALRVLAPRYHRFLVAGVE
ncbi:unnamed protein product, partial [Mesorhabditis spiculigera]